MRIYPTLLLLCAAVPLLQGGELERRKSDANVFYEQVAEILEARTRNEIEELLGPPVYLSLLDAVQAVKKDEPEIAQYFRKFRFNENNLDFEFLVIFRLSYRGEDHKLLHIVIPDTSDDNWIVSSDQLQMRKGDPEAAMKMLKAEERIILAEIKLAKLKRLAKPK